MIAIDRAHQTLRQHLLVFVALLTLLSGTFTQTSSAQEPADQEPATPSDETEDAPFQFLTQTSFVPANGDYTMTLSGFEDASELAGATVDVVLYTLLEDAASLQTEPEDIFNRLPTQDVSDVINDQNEIELSIPVRNSSDGDQNRILLPDPGVYPIVVEFRLGDSVVQSIRTNLIRLPADELDDDNNIVPTPVAELPGITIGLDVTENGYSIADANELLEGVIDLPLLVVIDQSTIEQLQADDADSRDFIRNVAELQVVVTHGAGVDVSTVASIGQTGLLQQRLERLHQNARDLGLEPASNTLVETSAVTPTGVEALRTIDVSTVVMTDQDPDNQNPIERWGTLQTGDSTVTIVPSYVPPALDQSPALWTHRLASALTIDQRQSGGQPTFIFLGPNYSGAGFDSDDLAVLIDGQDQAFRFEPLDQLTTDLEPLEAATQPTLDLNPHRQAIESIVAQINTYETTHLDGSQTPTMFRDDLLAALGSGPTTSSERTEILDGLHQTVTAEIQSLNVPDGQAVTVAAEMVRAPLTIENTSDGSRQVRLVVDSDKVEILQDGQILTIPPGGSSIDLDVEVRSLGVSPVQISVYTPDGRNRLASTRFEVRSTAIPGLGLLLCLLGAILLAFWWYVHVKKRRNKKNDTRSGDISDRKSSRRPAAEPTTPRPTIDDPEIEETVSMSATDTSGGHIT